nr:hypothetical protein [Actinomycetota bacterium]
MSRTARCLLSSALLLSSAFLLVGCKKPVPTIDEPHVGVPAAGQVAHLTASQASAEKPQKLYCDIAYKDFGAKEPDFKVTWSLTPAAGGEKNTYFYDKTVISLLGHARSILEPKDPAVGIPPGKLECEFRLSGYVKEFAADKVWTKSIEIKNDNPLIGGDTFCDTIAKSGTCRNYEKIVPETSKRNKAECDKNGGKYALGKCPTANKIGV